MARPPRARPDAGRCHASGTRRLNSQRSRSAGGWACPAPNASSGGGGGSTCSPAIASNQIAARHPEATQGELMALWTEETYGDSVDPAFLAKARAFMLAHW